MKNALQEIMMDECKYLVGIDNLHNILGWELKQTGQDKGDRMVAHEGGYMVAWERVQIMAQEGGLIEAQSSGQYVDQGNEQVERMMSGYLMKYLQQVMDLQSGMMME